jgi:hypothetical protein
MNMISMLGNMILFMLLSFALPSYKDPRFWFILIVALIICGFNSVVGFMAGKGYRGQ